MFSKSLAATTLLVGAVSVFAGAAKADVIVVHPDATVISVPTVVRTAVPTLVRTTTLPSVIETRTVTTPGAINIISSPGVIHSYESVTTRTTTEPAVLTVESTLGSFSNYRHRLDLMLDQISMGEQRGWITADIAADLKAQYDALSASERDLEARGEITTDETDALETGLNLLNQRIANSMVQR